MTNWSPIRSLGPLALVIALAPLTFATQGCSASPPEGENDGIIAESSPAARSLAAGHPMRIVPWGSSLASTSPDHVAARNTSAPTGAHLTYYGGRVISNVQVIQVLYGTGNYAPAVQGTATPSLSSFYQQVTSSALWDWLSEYNTNVTPAGGGAGTNQLIGRGSFGSQVAISPSSTNNATTIDDSNIQREISAQITAGHLPAPQMDAAGNVNTIYMINFPHGKSITQGGTRSCAAGGFCAYHGTLTRNGQSLYYGVLPDMQAGSGCDSGCGSDPSTFNNQTSVASHELIEAVTDAEVGLATTAGPPLGWYDNTNGEIGDICNAQQGTIAGSDGVTYVVQKEFSNVANNCIVTRTTTATNDFSVTTAPTSLTVAAGASETDTVKTAVTSGSAQTVALSVTGAPAFVTATLSPTPLTAGQSATLTVTASGSAAPGNYALTVKGTAGSTSHTAALTLTITGGTTTAGGVTNGGFESGSFAGWTTTGSTSIASTGAHGGASAGELGAATPSTDSTASQTFAAPSGTTKLSFFYKNVCTDTVRYDWATATLRDNTTGTTKVVLAKVCTTTPAWTNVSAVITAGHSYTLTLSNHDDAYTGDPTYTLFDDVLLQ